MSNNAEVASSVDAVLTGYGTVKTTQGTDKNPLLCAADIATSANYIFFVGGKIF